MIIREDVLEKLMDKGFAADSETIEKVTNNFKNALIMNGYWEILEQTIDNSDLEKPQFNIENIEVGKEYVIMPIVYIKAALHNKKVKVEEKVNDEVIVTVLGGRMKGSKLGLQPETLKAVEE